VTDVAENMAAKTDPRAFVYAAGVFAYIVVVTVGQSTTTIESYFAIQLVRIAAAAVVVLCLLSLSGWRFRKRQLMTLAIFSSLVIWAVLASMLSQSLSIASEGLLIDIVVVVAGLLIFSRADAKVLPDVLSKVLVLYTVLAASGTLMAGGLMLDFPPRFWFEYGSDQFGAELMYGQGASNFYALGAIAAAFWMVRCKSFLETMLPASLMVLTAALSVIGGARGDTTIGLFIIVMYIGLRAPGKSALWLGLLVCASVLLISDWVWIEDLIYVKNMLAIGAGDFGSRDFLQGQVIDLLVSNPWCLVTGCGVGYFQYFYGYELGMYPHNLVLESLVMFGLPLTTIFVFASVFGGVLYYRRMGECDLFLLVTLYAVGVSMKSGSFFGSWLALAGCLYLASHCFVGRKKPLFQRMGEA
jgi:hypothetical protein